MKPLSCLWAVPLAVSSCNAIPTCTVVGLHHTFPCALSFGVAIAFVMCVPLSFAQLLHVPATSASPKGITPLACPRSFASPARTAQTQNRNRVPGGGSPFHFEITSQHPTIAPGCSPAFPWWCPSSELDWPRSRCPSPCCLFISDLRMPVYCLTCVNTFSSVNA